MQEKTFNKYIFSWAIYDLANTIFSMNVISVYFPLLITQTYKKPDIYYSLPLSISMFLLVLTLPILGRKSDKEQKRLKYLFRFTMLTIGFTLFMGFKLPLFTILLFLIIANYGYNASLIFYNALLLNITTSKNRGKISGIGVALGYFGSIVGMLAILPFVKGKFPYFPEGNQSAFIPTAVLFFILSLPTFIVLRKMKTTHQSQQLNITNETINWKQLIKSIRKLKKYPQLKRFLISRLFFIEAVNTIIAFMSVYCVKVYNFSAEGEVQKFLIISTIFAMLGSVIIGYFSDKFSHLSMLKMTLIIWIISILFAIISPNKTFFWIVGGLAGIALGGTWTADRPLLIELAPRENMAEFFSLYGITGKVAAIIGPIIWGVTISIFYRYTIIKYKIAISILLIFIIIGLLILNGIKKENYA